MVDEQKPVACPKCGGTVFIVDQLAHERRDFDTATGDWSAGYGYAADVDFPQTATCKGCGADATDMLNEDTIEFYGLPDEREPLSAIVKVDRPFDVGDVVNILPTDGSPSAVRGAIRFILDTPAGPFYRVDGCPLLLPRSSLTKG